MNCERRTTGGVNVKIFKAKCFCAIDQCIEEYTKKKPMRRMD